MRTVEGEVGEEREHSTQGFVSCVKGLDLCPKRNGKALRELKGECRWETHEEMGHLAATFVKQKTVWRGT